MRTNTLKQTSITTREERNTKGILLTLDVFDCPALPFDGDRDCKTGGESVTIEKDKWVLAQELLKNETFLDIWNYAIRPTSDTLFKPGISEEPVQLPAPKAGDLSVLENLYNLINKDAVVKFVKENNYLIEVLSEANTAIKQFFPEADLYLRLAIDPDSETLEKELVLYISTDLTARAAIELRNKFFENWWYDNGQRTNNKITIDLAFK